MPAISPWSRSQLNLRGCDAFADSPFRKIPYLLTALCIIALHVGLFWVGKFVIVRGSQVSPTFPGAGLDLVILLVFGTRYWPILLASYFASAMARDVPWLPSCGVAAATLLRTLLSAALVRRVSYFKRILGPFEDVAGILLAGVIAAGAGALAGTASLAAAGTVPVSEWSAALRRWWIADGMSIFVATPALLTIARSYTSIRRRWSPWYALHLVVYFAGVSVVCYTVFFRPDTRYLLFSVFLLILIAAAWLGPAAAQFAALTISFAAMSATRIGVGAFAGGTFREDLQNLAYFLVAVSITGLAVGAFRTIGNLALPAGVLLAGWACSAWLYASLDLGRATYDQQRFQGLIQTVETRIQSGYRSFEDVGWNTAGFLAAARPISPSQWQSYIDGLRLPDRYPGVDTISPVPPDGFSGDSAERAAAERSRDSGTAVLTRAPANETGAAARLQLLVPVYRTGATLRTTESRRSATLGWISIEFRAGPFLDSALADARNLVRLQVSDARDGAVFVSSATVVAPQRITHLALGSTAWTLAWSPLPGFPYLSRGPFALAAGCTALLSLLVAGLVLILQNTRRRASYRWKLLQSASALGTWELDLDSETVHCSEQFLRLYGLLESRERLSMTEWLAFIHPDDRKTILDEIHCRRGSRQPIDWQYRVVWPDGSVHWLHSKALPVVEGGDLPNRIVGVDFDISEMKQLQSQLAQAQKLQSVGQLAAGVAHEINTPIQYIGDNGKFLEEAFRDLIRLSEARDRANPSKNTASDSDHQALTYLKAEVPRAASELLEGVTRVARIVRAMKEFSHPGAIESSAADINRAIENTILVSKTEWKDVADVTTDLDPNLPLVPCVIGEINQVLLNLIVNAAHAIADVAKTSGRKGAIHITTRQSDSLMEIRVSDTGGGIPEAIQSQIFNPFFTTKPVGKGTGQGLAIAHAVIVQKHSGILTFETEPGRGTTFIVQLPLVREMETA